MLLDAGKKRIIPDNASPVSIFNVAAGTQG